MFCLEGKGLKNQNFKDCKSLYLLIFGRFCDIIVAKVISIIAIPSLDSACLKNDQVAVDGLTRAA